LGIYGGWRTEQIDEHTGCAVLLTTMTLPLNLVH
jgi:hypothetical protein